MPQGNLLYAAWSPSATELWTVGHSGTILHSSSGIFSVVYSGTTNPLRAVWGTSATDAWAAGDAGTVLHFDGSTWGPAPAGSPSDDIYGIWGSSATDVWFAGRSGIWRWNGVGFVLHKATASPVRAVWGTGATSLWAVGDGGAIWQGDGTSWTSRASGTTSALYGLWGSAPDDVWAVGADGTILRWQGTSWTRIASGAAATLILRGAWGSSSKDVWAASLDGLWHFDGASWTAASGAAGDLYAVFGNDAASAWAVGASGAVLRWNGATWAAANALPIDDLHAVWGSGAGDVYFLSGLSRKLVRFRGAALSTAAGPTPDRGLWGAGPADVWAVGGGGDVAHFDGSSWSAVASGTTSDLNAVSGSGAKDVWAVGSGGTIRRYDGAGFAGYASGTTSALRAVWARTASDVWAVGDDGAALHWDGLLWSKRPSGTTAVLRGVHGTAADSVWVVGDGGTILYWDGAAFMAAGSGTSSALYGVAAAAPNDVWAVGAQGVMVRFDGYGWHPVVAPGKASLRGVWAQGNEAWFVGDGGAILHSRSLIINGDFATAGSPIDAWNAHVNPLEGGNALFELDSVQFHDAPPAVKVTNMTKLPKDWPVQLHQYDNRNLRGGNCYKVSFYSRAAKGRLIKVQVDYQVDPLDPKNYNFVDSVKTVPVGTGWQPFQYYLQPASTMTISNARLDFLLADDLPIVWLDDVTFEDLGPWPLCPR